MSISVRKSQQLQPVFSLTADLQNFLQCGLQYRYARNSQLPWSDSPQLWFGRFVCDCLQQAQLQVRQGLQPQPPWDSGQIEQLCDMVTARLQTEQIVCRSRTKHQNARQCVTAAINTLGAVLFPLISAGPVPVSGSRWFPAMTGSGTTRDTPFAHFFLTGTVPALLQFSATDRSILNSPLRQALQAHGLMSDEHQTVLVDFKTAHRPDLHRRTRHAAAANADSDHWRALVLAWLLSQQAEPPTAAVVVYLRELWPSAAALRRLREACFRRTPDVLLPNPDSPDAALLTAPHHGQQLTPLSSEYRLHRAFRIIPITQAAMQAAMQTTDHTADRIRTCQNQEIRSGRILNAWERNNHSQVTCAACRARTWCPGFHGK
jgi:hypothetical protein